MEIPILVRDYVVLQEVAAGHGKTPEQWLAEHVARLIERRRTGDQLVAFYLRGLTDGEIAGKMGIRRRLVADRRRALELPPNRRSRT